MSTFCIFISRQIENLSSSPLSFIARSFSLSFPFPCLNDTQRLLSKRSRTKERRKPRRRKLENFITFGRSKGKGQKAVKLMIDPRPTREQQTGRTHHDRCSTAQYAKVDFFSRETMPRRGKVGKMNLR